MLCRLQSYWCAALVMLVPLAAKGASSELVPPPDAQWTILCESFAGSNHQAEAHDAKDFWAHATNLPGFYVVHQADQSILYYGYYRSINDPHDRKETERAQSDRLRLQQITDTGGSHPFFGCVFVELVPKDPPAPPEWNLANAKGKWSLQVAVYENDPRRKQYAVDAVRDMRAHGIEAYFYHGPTASSICIGAWPDAAVKMDQAAPADPNQPVIVTNENVAGDDLYLRSTGQKLQQATPKVQILDPTLQAKMTEYPYEAINGEMEIRDADNKVVKGPTPTYVVEIPHDQPSDTNAPPTPSDSSQLPSAFVPPPPPPSDATTGGLRSIDSK